MAIRSIPDLNKETKIGKEKKNEGRETERERGVGGREGEERRRRGREGGRKKERINYSLHYLT